MITVVTRLTLVTSSPDNTRSLSTFVRLSSPLATPSLFSVFFVFSSLSSLSSLFSLFSLLHPLPQLSHKNLGNLESCGRFERELAVTGVPETPRCPLPACAGAIGGGCSEGSELAGGGQGRFRQGERSGRCWSSTQRSLHIALSVHFILHTAFTSYRISSTVCLIASLHGVCLLGGRIEQRDRRLAAIGSCFTSQCFASSVTG